MIQILLILPTSICMNFNYKLKSNPIKYRIQSTKTINHSVGREIKDCSKEVIFKAGSLSFAKSRNSSKDSINRGLNKCYTQANLKIKTSPLKSQYITKSKRYVTKADKSNDGSCSSILSHSVSKYDSKYSSTPKMSQYNVKVNLYKTFYSSNLIKCFL